MLICPCIILYKFVSKICLRSINAIYSFANGNILREFVIISTKYISKKHENVTAKLMDFPEMLIILMNIF